MSLSRLKRALYRLKTLKSFVPRGFQEYQQLREQYNSYFEAYTETDGSKCEQKVAAV